MKKNDIEFAVGDRVTFMPYEKAIPAKIEGVDVDRLQFQDDDERVFYEITPIHTDRYSNEYEMAICVATGMTIKESKYFEEYDEDSE